MKLDGIDPEEERRKFDMVLDGIREVVSSRIVPYCGECAHHREEHAHKCGRTIPFAGGRWWHCPCPGFVPLVVR